MGRRGLNATLSYLHGRQRRVYRVRCNLLTHGMTVLYEESQARVKRAFYPHRLSSAQFLLGVQVVGQAEYRSLSSWLATYADYVLEPGLRFGEFPAMAVSVPSRDFLRKGVPLSGMEWGDRVGAMVWSPQIVFETSEEPLDRNKKVALSHVGGPGLYEKTTKFFYPTGTQLGGQDVPADGSYTQPVSIEDIVGGDPNKMDPNEKSGKAVTGDPLGRW